MIPERRHPALVALDATDIDRVMDLEERAFEPSIRASRDTVLHRFSLGHQMFGAEDGAQLVGAIAFSPVRFAVDDPASFPTSFKAYSTQPIPSDANTLCLYSLGIEPAARGVACARLLVHAALEEGRRQGLSYAIADGPLPSYAGNEQVPARAEVRRMVDRYAATGELPQQEEFLQDPILALYHRLTACQFLALIPDFLPEDTASGGWRVLLYREL